jgi:hypothetical protein
LGNLFLASILYFLGSPNTSQSKSKGMIIRKD